MHTENDNNFSLSDWWQCGLQFVLVFVSGKIKCWCLPLLLHHGGNGVLHAVTCALKRGYSTMFIIYYFHGNLQPVSLPEYLPIETLCFIYHLNQTKGKKLVCQRNTVGFLLGCDMYHVEISQRFFPVSA